MFTTPFTFGSMTKLRPVISATALTTASMSALTKFSVTLSSTGAMSAGAAGAVAKARKRSAKLVARAARARRQRREKSVTRWRLGAGAARLTDRKHGPPSGDRAADRP